MDKLFRFSDYDIFAYLGAGLAALVAWDFVFGTRCVLGAQWSPSEAIAIIFSAYIVGHVVAWPAACLLERRFVSRVLGAPSKTLLGNAPPGRIASLKKKLFPDYFTPLDHRLAERVKNRAWEQGQPDVSGESLFWTAYSSSKRDPSTYARMDSFLKLYGFCRNIAFIGVASSALILGEVLWHSRARGWNFETQNRLLWAGVALAGGVAMFYRYLKFHRLYSVEVFVGYAESNSPPIEVKNEISDP